MLERILKRNGYATDTAETGREAEEKLSTGTHDLALIDVRLPDMDGLELLNKIQNLQPKMRKIVLTGLPSMEDGIKAVDCGADAYLVKPIASEELLRLLKEKLKN